MNTYIGIDLGTSGVKLLLVAADGKILAEVTEHYPVSTPRKGWSEQNPGDWIEAMFRGLKRLLNGQERAAVKGISFGGQMHGLVVLDRDDKVIRPCILWNDGRTEQQTAYLNEAVGRETLTKRTGNIAFAGFTAPKLLWMKENEPNNFSRIAKILLPKDYLSYVLSGNFCTDYSDASGTLLFDVKNRCWNEKMCDVCNISVDQLPELCESFAVTGKIKAQIAEELGLSENVNIVAGAGDNAAAAIGTGTVNAGDCNLSLGTSGTIFLCTEKFTEEKKNALHSFCHANGKWHLMGCILSAASARKWWLEDILSKADYDGDEKEIAEAGCSDVLFLPYLRGERSPHNDVNARGAFIGLSATTTRGQMSRAVMEGVAFALRDCLEIARANGIEVRSTKLCGGGAKSKAWRQIVADILDLPVDISKTEQGPAYGGAILAMVGCGEYETVQTAARAIIRVRETVLPAAAAAYEERYRRFIRLYPALRDLNQ